MASVFVTAAALIIASALKHNDAVADCQVSEEPFAMQWVLTGPAQILQLERNWFDFDGIRDAQIRRTALVRALCMG